MWAELVPAEHPVRNAMMLSLRKHGGVPRMLASRIFEQKLDDRLGTALGYLFERSG